jgi:hypothetical protein
VTRILEYDSTMNEQSNNQPKLIKQHRVSHVIGILYLVTLTYTTIRAFQRDFQSSPDDVLKWDVETFSILIPALLFAGIVAFFIIKALNRHHNNIPTRTERMKKFALSLKLKYEPGESNLEINNSTRHLVSGIYRKHSVMIYDVSYFHSYFGGSIVQITVIDVDGKNIYSSGSPYNGWISSPEKITTILNNHIKKLG